MWQCSLHEPLHGSLPTGDSLAALLSARENMKALTTTQYTEAALAVARRTLHEFDLVPHFHSGPAHSRSYFLLLELYHSFPEIAQCLKTSFVKTLHLDMGAGGFIDALLKLAPSADWHGTSSTEVYEHIRIAKKPNGHARLLHNSISQEVGDPMIITIQGSQILSNLQIALDILHPQGILIIQCENPYMDIIPTCMSMFEHVYLCKPSMVAPSSSDFIIIASIRKSTPSSPMLSSWLIAREILTQLEINGIARAIRLATYLTQMNIKTTTDTQKFYLDHIATNPSRMEKAQRILSKIAV